MPRQSLLSGGWKANDPEGFKQLRQVTAGEGNSPATAMQLIFIVRQEHEERFQLKTELDRVLKEWNRGPQLSWVFVMMHADTRGAVETCLLAKSVIDLDAPIVVMDCDLFVRSKPFEQCLLSIANKHHTPSPADGGESSAV